MAVDLKQRFSKAVENFANKTKAVGKNITAEVARAIFYKVVMDSPVDTGLFKASWRVGINETIRRVAHKKDWPRRRKGETRESRSAAAQQAVLAANAGKFPKIRFGDRVNITNNVFYARRVENRTGVMRRAEISVYRLLEQAVRKARGR